MQKAAPGACRERGETETSILLLCSQRERNSLPSYEPWCTGFDMVDLYRHLFGIPGTFSLITKQSSLYFSVLFFSSTMSPFGRQGIHLSRYRITDQPHPITQAHSCRIVPVDPFQNAETFALQGVPVSLTSFNIKRLCCSTR